MSLVAYSLAWTLAPKTSAMLSIWARRALVGGMGVVGLNVSGWPDDKLPDLILENPEVLANV